MMQQQGIALAKSEKVDSHRGKGGLGKLQENAEVV